MVGLLLSIGTKRSIQNGLVNPKVFLNGLAYSKRYFSFSSAWNNNYDKSSASSLSSSYLDNTSQFNITFAYQPKDREETNVFKKKNQKPSPALESPTGEDNLFISNIVDGKVAVGVADGVGGWSEAGYDSSAISRELCNFIKEGFESASDSSPTDLLIQSFDKVLKSPKVEIGGTTACLGIFTPDMKLHVANLGDSWCGLFRDYKLVNETNFQTHNFNTPFQLAKIPPQIIRQAQLNGKRYIVDKPEFADKYTWDLQKDDIILFATDGVTDNIIPRDIEIFLKDNFEKILTKKKSLQILLKK